MTLSAGQRQPLRALNLTGPFAVTVTSTLPGTDISAFGLSGGKLSDDRYMVFYNQPSSPDGAVSVQGNAFTFDLARLSPQITEYVVTATHDSAPLSSGTLKVTLGSAHFDASAALSTEKAAMLLRFYQHNGEWRVEAVGQGFNGGLAALVRHFGGEVADEAAPPANPTAAAPTTAPTAAPQVNLTKQRQQVLLSKAEQEAPELVSLIKQASVSLEKRGLGEARYRVNLVLDISASMTDEYRSGAVGELAKRALALAARLDNDGEVEVYLFGIRGKRAGTMTISNSQQYVKSLKPNFEGGTRYLTAMELVREDARNAGFKVPTLVLFITDGATEQKERVAEAMKQSSSEPIFWKFMGIQQGHTRFDFLEKLDDLRGRVVDNADFFSVRSPINISDQEMFELLVNELDTWQKEAERKNVIR